MPDHANSIHEWVAGKEFDQFELKIIEALEKHPEGLGFNELARELKDFMSRSTLNMRLRRLEEKDVVKVVRGRPGQKHIIFLTKWAKELAGLFKDIAEVELKVLQCQNILMHEVLAGVKKFETFMEEYEELWTRLLEYVFSITLTDVSKKFPTLVAPKIMDLLRGIVLETFKLTSTSRDLEKKVVERLRSKALQDLESFYNRVVEEGKKLGVIREIKEVEVIKLIRLKED